MQDPLGKTTTFGWNALGQLLTQTDALGRETGYGYDVAGRRTERKLPGGASEQLAYDGAGQLISRTDFDGSLTSFEYDGAGRPNKVYRSDGSQTIGYDSYGNPNAWTDSTDGSLSRSTNTGGHVVSDNTSHYIDFGAGLASYSSNLTYLWDANGNRTQFKNSTLNQTSAASYDALGHLASVTAPDGSITTFSYDAAGNRSQTTRADGGTTDYRYNAANQLIGLTHRKADTSILAQFDYTLDAAGRRTQANERINASSGPVVRTVVYSYDAAGKLLSEGIAQTQPSAFNLGIGYQYDAAGNRTQRVLSGDISRTTTYQYDSNDRLTQTSDTQNGITTYSWDARGNLSSKTNGAVTTRYTWRSDNRLLSISDGSKTISYAYNPLGQRIKRYVVQGSGASATTTRTHYQIDNQRPYSEIVAESTQVGTGAWATQANHITPTGTGELLQSTSAAGSQQIYGDGPGHTRLVIDSAGNAVALSYDAFGVDLNNPASATNHRYNGEYLDKESGLIHLRARDYDAEVGRFISMDEHPGQPSIPLTLNKYLYANADPVNFSDPSGNFLISDPGAAMVLQSLPRLAATTGGVAVGLAIKVRIALYMAAAAYGTYQIIDTTVKQEIRKCIDDAKAGGKKCRLDFSMLIVGDDNNEVRDHISDALGVGYPSRVHRRIKENPRGWLRKYKGPGKACDDLSKQCDEYPMAIHVEGGESNAPSLRSVDGAQNGSVGSLARWLHEKCQIPVNGEYMVAPIKGMPVSGYICGK